MNINRRYEKADDFLKKNKLRYSKQKLVAIDELFFNNYDKEHYKIQELLTLMNDNHNDFQIANATLSNILKDLCEKGFLKQVYINKPYYDINTKPHLHFYNTKTDELINTCGEDCLNCEKGCLSYISNNIPLLKGQDIKDISFVMNTK